MTARSLFISLEGPEGSGKSSQARRLVAALRRAGWRVVFVCDPGSTRLGERLRTTLLHDRARLSPLAEALLFIAGRKQLVEEHLLPALRRGAIVVCDRFHDSTIAYQGFGGRLNIAWLERLGRTAIGHLMPDLTFLLDVPTTVGLARLKGPRDRMERKARAFHQRVRLGYRRIARGNPRRVMVIDATQPQAQIHRQLLATVLQRLADKSSRLERSR